MAIQDNPGAKLIGEIGNPYGKLDPQSASIVANSSLEQLTNGLDKAKSFAQNVDTKKQEIPQYIKKPDSTQKPTVNPVQNLTQNIQKKAEETKAQGQQAQQTAADLQKTAKQQTQDIVAQGLEKMNPKQKEEYYSKLIDDKYKDTILSLSGDMGADAPLIHTSDWFINSPPDKKKLYEQMNDTRKQEIEGYAKKIQTLKNDPKLSTEEKYKALDNVNNQLKQYNATFNANLEKMKGTGSANVTDTQKQEALTPPVLKSGITEGQKEIPQKKQEQVQTAVQTATTLGKESTTKDAQSVLDKTNKALKGMPDNTLRDVLELIAKVAKGILGQDFETSAQKERGIERDIAKMNEAIAMEQQAKLSEETNQTLQNAKLKNLRDQEQVKYGFDIGKIYASKEPDINVDTSKLGKAFLKGGNK